MNKDRDETIAKLTEAMRTMKHIMHGRMQAALQASPVSHAQLELLFTIHRLQPVSFKQLATQLCLTPGAVSQLVDGLESSELVTREIDTHDRRIQCLRLSKKGVKLLGLIGDRQQKMMETVMQSCSVAELKVWLRIQQRIISEFQADPTNTNRNKGTKA